MLQLDRNRALQGWLATHNVSLDVLGSDDPWPLPVARVADLLSLSDSQRTDRVSKAWAEDFADVLCACTRQVRKTRSTDRFHWESVFAMVMQQALPEVVTYFNCEYVKPRADDVHGARCDQSDPGSSYRGTASMLALLPVDPPALTFEDHAPRCGGDEFSPSPHKGKARCLEHIGDHPKEPPPVAVLDNTSEFEVASHMSLDLGSYDSGASSDATLYELEDAESSSELSIEVEIEDVPEESSREPRDPPLDSKSSPAPSEGRHSSEGKRATAEHDPGTEATSSVATEYSSALHTTSSCSPSSPSSASQASSLSPFQDHHHHDFPGPLYDNMPSYTLQHHILPSPFYPKPLFPVLCVADEWNIVPLMCSALHQRRMLALDVPVVGVLLSRTSPPRCEVLFGWMEREVRAGYSLPRAHIIVGDVLVDMQSSRGVSRIVRFLARLGPYVAQSVSRRTVSPSGSARNVVWRADTRVHKSESRKSIVDERIMLWAHNVCCCNQSDDDEDVSYSPAARRDGNAGVDDLRELIKFLRTIARRDCHHHRAPTPGRRSSEEPSQVSIDSLESTTAKTSTMANPESSDHAIDSTKVRTSTTDDTSACVSSADDYTTTTIWQRLCASVGAWYYGNEEGTAGERSTIASTSSSTCVDPDTSA